MKRLLFGLATFFLFSGIAMAFRSDQTLGILSDQFYLLSGTVLLYVGVAFASIVATFAILLGIARVFEIVKSEW